MSPVGTGNTKAKMRVSPKAGSLGHLPGCLSPVPGSVIALPRPWAEAAVALAPRPRPGPSSQPALTVTTGQGQAAVALAADLHHPPQPVGLSGGQ